MADGPEALYADLTSGQPSAVDVAVDSCRTTIRQLADAIDMIDLATDTPQWDSSEDYQAYNLRAWATRAAAEVTLIRTNRALLSLQIAARSYSSMVESATDVIEWWRQTKRSDISGDTVSLARAVALTSLFVVRSTFNSQLSEAIDFIETDPMSKDQETWRKNGLIKSMLHDLNSPGTTGPSIPNTLATGDDDGGWKPQGLGFDPDGDPPVLLQTAYSGDRAQLALVDPETGEQLRLVDLGGIGTVGAPDHAGGVAVHDGVVNVMSSGKNPKMYSYSLQDVRDATPDQTITPSDIPMPTKAGAYSTIDGDTLYVGTFEENDPGALYTYKWDRGSQEWVEQPGSHPTPPRAQGAAVVDGQIVFSTSFGRGDTSELQAYRISDVLAGHGSDADHRLGQIRLPTMSEGIVAMDGTGLITTYESGASGHSRPKGDVTLADLWGSQSMTITPFSALGMIGGIDVEPVSLARASVDFQSGARRLQSAASSIDHVSLPAGCLGATPTGDTFTSLIRTHCDTTAGWIAEGRISADITADGLVTSAASYVATDQAVREAFASISTWLGGS